MFDDIFSNEELLKWRDQFISKGGLAARSPLSLNDLLSTDTLLWYTKEEVKTSTHRIINKYGHIYIKNLWLCVPCIFN